MKFIIFGDRHVRGDFLRQTGEYNIDDGAVYIEVNKEAVKIGEKIVSLLWCDGALKEIWDSFRGSALTEWRLSCDVMLLCICREPIVQHF